MSLLRRYQAMNFAKPPQLSGGRTPRAEKYLRTDKSRSQLAQHVKICEGLCPLLRNLGPQQSIPTCSPWSLTTSFNPHWHMAVSVYGSHYRTTQIRHL